MVSWRTGAAVLVLAARVRHWVLALPALAGLGTAGCWHTPVAHVGEHLDALREPRGDDTRRHARAPGHLAVDQDLVLAVGDHPVLAQPAHVLLQLIPREKDHLSERVSHFKSMSPP